VYITHDRDQEIDGLYQSLNAPRPVLIVLSGPSGVGKDSILQGLKQTNYPFYFVVTATTRPIRPNEADGVDYHFVSVGDFAEMIENDELLEYAVVYGDYKGIPKKHVREALASGQRCDHAHRRAGRGHDPRARAQRSDDLPDRRKRGGAGAPAATAQDRGSRISSRCAS
jgi:ribose 1,5-bisphosphokinase PhnN